MDLNGKNNELIKELVGLSTKHGILTPYTSFLADDQGPANRLTNNRRELEMTRERLSRLQEAGGRAGFAQRDLKKRLKDASQLQSADFFGDESIKLAAKPARFGMNKSANAPAAGNASGFRPAGRGGRGIGGGGAGGGGLGGRSFGQNGGDGVGNEKADLAGESKSQPLASGGAILNDIDSDKKLAVDSVLTVGKNTLYRRGMMLIDASAKDVDLTKDKKAIVEIKRFSKEYFDLTAKNSKSENAVLALQKDKQQLLIKLRGKVYLIK